MSLANTVERTRAKSDYKKFSKEWVKIRKTQLQRLALGQEIPPGEKKLGKRPPFAIWFKWLLEMQADAVKKVTAQLEQAMIEKAKEEDTSWENPVEQKTEF